MEVAVKVKLKIVEEAEDKVGAIRKVEGKAEEEGEEVEGKVEGKLIVEGKLMAKYRRAAKENGEDKKLTEVNADRHKWIQTF